jgi:hypothetical protein
MINIIAICSLMFACNIYATELEKIDIEKCSYLGGIARETQVIRIATEHSFEEFKLHTDKIYKKDDSYTILLGVVGGVFASVDLREEPTDVFNALFDYCINQANSYKEEEGREAV